MKGQGCAHSNQLSGLIWKQSSRRLCFPLCHLHQSCHNKAVTGACSYFRSANTLSQASESSHKSTALQFERLSHQCLPCSPKRQPSQGLQIWLPCHDVSDPGAASTHSTKALYQLCCTEHRAIYQAVSPAQSFLGGQMFIREEICAPKPSMGYLLTSPCPKQTLRIKGDTGGILPPPSYTGTHISSQQHWKQVLNGTRIHLSLSATFVSLFFLLISDDWSYCTVADLSNRKERKECKEIKAKKFKETHRQKVFTNSLMGRELRMSPSWTLEDTIPCQGACL